MEQQLRAELVAARAGQLFFYSPYYFLRQLDGQKQQELFGTGRAAAYLNEPGHRLFEFESEAETVQFLYADLSWDTEFFQTPFYKLFTLLFAPEVSARLLVEAVEAFRAHLAGIGAFYIFAELPAEDTRAAQALSGGGWRLIETRQTYFREAVSSFEHPRYAVRPAQLAEAAAVGRVAATARNPYDRFHADPWFAPALGDAFLARYATAAVEGYCDEVLVPAEPNLPLDSFLAISDLRPHATALGIKLARVVLTAVGSQNRGWHLKLTAETMQRAKIKGADYVLMTTQATNHAVFRTCEKLGFKLGSCSQVFALSSE